MAIVDREVSTQNGSSADSHAGRSSWSRWPNYEAAVTGFTDVWYPVAWSRTIGKEPVAIAICGTEIVVMRDRDGQVHALHNRCVHRGVKLSLGRQEFPGTLTCAYHGWTYELKSGTVVAAITDGPDSPVCGRLSVQRYATAERLGMVWVFFGEATPPSVDSALPEELVDADLLFGGDIEIRDGNWRFAAENGFDEGHAKYLHRNALWRLFKTMPTWNKTRVTTRGRWIYRVQEEVHWSADFPGLGHWSNSRWWKLERHAKIASLGNVAGATAGDPAIEAQEFPGFASIAFPGVLRIAYPRFIHYEWYVPVDADHHRYVGLLVRFQRGWMKAPFVAKYLFGFRPFFHGQFSKQDAWMVRETDAPPERLYRPDVSLVAWRKLCEDAIAARQQSEGAEA